MLVRNDLTGDIGETREILNGDIVVNPPYGIHELKHGLKGEMNLLVWVVRK